MYVCINRLSIQSSPAQRRQLDISKKKDEEENKDVDAVGLPPRNFVEGNWKKKICSTCLVVAFKSSSCPFLFMNKKTVVYIHMQTQACYNFM